MIQIMNTQTLILVTEEYYVKDLKRAWKNKYDPNNEYTNIDPCDYSSVEEYHEAIMDFDIRSTKL